MRIIESSVTQFPSTQSKMYQNCLFSRTWLVCLCFGIVISTSPQAEGFPLISVKKDMNSGFSENSNLHSFSEKHPLLKEKVHYKTVLSLAGGKTQENADDKPKSPNVFSALWAAYNKQLETNGMRTRMLTSGGISALGDFLCQVITFAKSGPAAGFQLDLRRLVVFWCMGTFYFGTVIFSWFSLIDRFASKFYPSKEDNFKKSVLMISIDQTAGAVGVNGGFMYLFPLVTALSLGTFSLGSFADAWRALCKNMIPVLLVNLKIWPAANFANFLFVPLKLRLLFTNVVAVVYNVLLSLIVNS